MIKSYKNIISLNLYKSLLFSDFCLLKQKTYTSFCIMSYSKNKQYFCVANIIKVLEDFKILIFLLTKHGKFMKQYLIINAINTFFFEIFFKDKLDTKFKTYKRKMYVFAKDYLEFSFKPLTYNIYISLIDDLNFKKIKTLFLKNIFILYSVNYKVKKLFYNDYHLFNAIDDFKKIIFLIIFFKKLFIKK